MASDYQRSSAHSARNTAAFYSRNGGRYTGGSSDNGDGGKKRGRGIGRRAAIVGGAVLAVGAAGAAVTPALASGVIDDIKTKASTISDLLNQTIDQMKDMDFELATQTARSASTEVAALGKTMSGTLWDVAEVVPIIGEDIKASRKLIAMLGDLIDNALIPISTTLSDYALDTLIAKNEDGGMWFNLDAVEVIVRAINEAMPTISSSVETLEGIDNLHIPQLVEVVTKAKEKVAPLMGKVDHFGLLLDALPTLLGADGDRVYVVMAQNNVEIRAMGGFTGQCARITVSNGTVRIGDVASIYDYIPNEEWAQVPLSDEELNLFGNTIGYMAGNTGCDPDFPRVCGIWRQLWLNHQGEYVDGFIAIDPVVLQMLMGLTPGVDMYDGTHLDGSNTVRVLLHDTYWNYMNDPMAMDTYFSVAAGSALDCIVGNLSEMGAGDLLQVLDDAIDGYHLFAWFADERAQEAIVDLGMAGAFTHDPRKPQLGIYLNNESWSKIEWWLDEDFEISAPQHNWDGSRTYECRLTLSNSATWDEINVCNNYIVGGNVLKADASDILETLYIYAPEGGSVQITSTQGSADLWEGTHEGLGIHYGRVHNTIGNPFVIEFTVTTSPEAEEDLVVRMTPTVQNYR